VNSALGNDGSCEDLGELLLGSNNNSGLLSTFSGSCCARRVSAEAENLNSQYGTKGVTVQSGEGGLTKVALSSPDGRCYILLSRIPYSFTLKHHRDIQLVMLGNYVRVCLSAC